MLITCSNEESLEKLKGVVQNKFNSKYKVTTPKPFKPRLLITDVDKSLDDRNTFLESIVQNNDYLADCDIKVISVLKLKYSLSYIVEVDPDVRKIIITRGFLYTSWKKCFVRDHISVIRCFSCSRFGHVKKDCKNKSVCSLCSNDHDEKDCNSVSKKCVNCCVYNNYMKSHSRDFKPYSVDHAASDRQCPCFLKKSAELKSRIDYG
ncbi:unnamed protein product [Acanthoscelides obtectus]|uniref:CCHC-type domain-containing protein n=1 Tax=Acanthoscelides obtectus TaxID=200917 RepID=A0A9P0LWW6_ACAOB|nr:unnamed protein product [Acanthoscelides obtectus]CAK1649422.1 hypothetical protein AOBTE_LOCUS16228 [Acanthoscelides obtectus]